MAVHNHDKGRQVSIIERETNRAVLITCDLLAFVTCVAALFIYNVSGSEKIPGGLILFHVAFSAACIFGMRFTLKVYKQIWRTGNMRAFLRLIAADAIGGAIYIGMSRIVAQRLEAVGSIPFLRSASLVGFNLIAVIAMRVAYYYLFHFATVDNWIGRQIKTLLRTFALVDFDSDEPGALLRIVLEPATKSHDPINEVQRITRMFDISGEVHSITEIKKGYINRTYRVETMTDDGKLHMYTLQRINTNVFPDVDALMENFVLVTDYLHARLLLPGHGANGSVHRIRSTIDGRPYVRESSGCWRMMTHFDGVYTLDIPDSPQTFYYAGQAFGKFIERMSDIDADKIKTVIPNFHNTWNRYRELEEAVANDPVGRVKDVLPEIEFIRAHKYIYPIIAQKLESGQIPTRICHNDCNLNNILFDNETHLPVAIIDLDTVMPSSPLYDYGDSMRIGTNTAVDDEKDLSKVSCDLNLYEQYARGWLESCGKMLTKEELELLPYASLVITSEDGIRFLMDYINGDTYYNIFYPRQNLDRARTQLKLLKDMEKKLPEIKEILSRIYGELGLHTKLSDKETVA